MTTANLVEQLDNELRAYFEERHGKPLSFELLRRKAIPSTDGLVLVTDEGQYPVEAFFVDAKVRKQDVLVGNYKGLAVYFEQKFIIHLSKYA